jgi:hypothetical protein
VANSGDTVDQGWGGVVQGVSNDDGFDYSSTVPHISCSFEYILMKS